MRRTILIPHSPDEIYKKAFQWISLQGYQIEEQVHNQRITVSMGSANPMAFSVMQMFGAAWKMTLQLEATDDGTFVVGDLNGSGANQAYNQLVGILSLMPENKK